MVQGSGIFSAAFEAYSEDVRVGQSMMIVVMVEMTVLLLLVTTMLSMCMSMAAARRVLTSA